MVFDGWLKLFPGMIDEEILPELVVGDAVDCKELKPEQHFTEPPARYSDATLVKALEEYGIGRPSTYAPTIATIEDRGYVERDDNKRLYPKKIAFVVNDLLVEHFPQIVDYQFTAQMEENLDEIAEGTKDWQPIIATFYSPFHELIVQKSQDISKAETTMTRELGIDPKTGKKVSVRLGRFGAFAQLGEKPKFAKLTQGQNLDTVTFAEVLPLFELPKNLGQNEAGEDVIVAVGRFGPYAKIGNNNFSLRGHDPYTITLKEVLEATSEQAERKANAEIKTFADSDIRILNGKYGPYITNGKKNAKIPAGKEPAELTLVECEKLLIEAPTRKRRYYGKQKTNH
jgi:DNA topoisomerase-1